MIPSSTVRIPSPPAAEPAPPAGDEAEPAGEVEAATAGETSESFESDDAREPEDVPVRPARRTAGSAGDEIDLTGELGDLDANARLAGGEPSGKLDQAFERIRTDAETDGDFSTQHMTLARTYIEIGMLDEAIASLQTAVRSPRQRFEAAAALGRVYERRGDAALAIEWFERAAEAPAPTPDEGREVLYDLGVLLDGAGETSRALAVFLELQADAGDYRDAPARIDRLARVQTGG